MPDRERSNVVHHPFRPPRTPAALTRALGALRTEFGAGAERRKLALLRAVETVRMRRAADLVALHEAVLFVRAWPDSAAVLEAAEAELRRYPGRVLDLSPGTRDEVDESGLPHTSVYTAFSLAFVRWLGTRFPDAVDVYEEGESFDERLGEALAQLLLPVEAEAVADGYIAPREWLRETAPPGRTRLERLLAHLDALPVDRARRALIWSLLEVPVRWNLGAGPGSRTLARAPSFARHDQRRPLERSRLDLRAPASGRPFPVHDVAQDEAPAWIDLARAAVAVRLREVHTFGHASREDVARADIAPGVEALLIGVEPEARHALRAYFGYLLLRNGVPIGYGDAILLFHWGEINFHVFDTFRQGESARIYGSVIRLFQQRFGMRFLFLNRYQFGFHNPDAIGSGAFWFYEKLGFRPRDEPLRALWRRERERLEARPAYRSGPAVLRRLATGHMSLLLGGAASDPLEETEEGVYDAFHPMRLGLTVSRRVERDHGGDGVAALRAAMARVRPLLGGVWAGGELVALQGLAPLLDCIADLERWEKAELADLAAVVRAKAGRSERDYLVRTQGHRRLRDALLALSAGL